MTRLDPETLQTIPDSLAVLNEKLSQTTGHGLLSLAIRSSGARFEEFRKACERRRAMIVPISSGQGVLPGFARAVEAVLRYLGLPAEITAQTDVAGFGEAFNGPGDILFAADDHTFLAVHLANRTVVDNSWATASAFSHALACAAELKGGGVAGENVVVLGLGPVGTHAVEVLHDLGAKVLGYDSNRERLNRRTKTYAYLKPVDAFDKAVKSANYILDATPAANIIDATMIRRSTVISCPGVPHGLTRRALEQIGEGFIHDPLALGVAVMAVRSTMPPAP